MHRKRNRDLGLLELVAIALGGMVGGGIFTILGVSVSMIDTLSPVAIFIGGVIALLAAYSYVKLGRYYMDEGAAFSIIEKTYPKSHFAPSIVGWLVIFGYISTLALYAYTFSSYLMSGFGLAGNALVQKAVAVGIIGVFAAVNVWSVNGMGKLEDIMVYTKIVILIAISAALIKFGAPNLNQLMSSLSSDIKSTALISVLIVSSITFVAYEGFELLVSAVSEMKRPDKNLARGIYIAIALAVLIYLVIAVGALMAIPAKDIINNKEYALAAGAGAVMGKAGSTLVIIGAVLATSSAASGTLFGASRQVSVVAENGYMPSILSRRKNDIPIYAVLLMAVFSSVLVIIGGLQLILEFGSITFLLVSLLIAASNLKMRRQTKSSLLLCVIAVVILAGGGILILYYEFTHELKQMLVIVALYVVLSAAAYLYARRREKLAPKKALPDPRT